MNIAFGPVPSRRLGRSLGINNIPPKSCTYSCLYCQVGTTLEQKIKPQSFYAPEDILEQVRDHLEKIPGGSESVDYLTFVPDGEPTLDVNLGKTISLLRQLNIPIAVISNASLLWREEVRAALAGADWVSIKIDSIDERIWQQINRPCDQLDFDHIRKGIRQFASDFAGTLVTETMLVDGINDSEASISGVAGFIAGINASISYLAVPTRPTAASGIRAPDEYTLNHCYQIMADALPNVEYLVGYEGDAFSSTGDSRQDLLSITAVHPMRESAVRELLARGAADWSLVDELIAEGALIAVDYRGQRYIMRRFLAEHKNRHGDTKCR